MGKCTNCGKRIEYNQFKRYRGKILCYDCYKNRNARKKAKKLEQTIKDEALDFSKLEKLDIPVVTEDKLKDKSIGEE